LEPNYSGEHGFQLTTRRLTQQITDGVTANVTLQEIRFSRFSVIQRERESLFWQLPSKFTGNQVGDIDYLVYCTRNKTKDKSVTYSEAI